jgi:hypothetical protein
MLAKDAWSKPAGRGPPAALLFVSQQKVSKKWLPLRLAFLSPLFGAAGHRPCRRPRPVLRGQENGLPPALSRTWPVLTTTPVFATAEQIDSPRFASGANEDAPTLSCSVGARNHRLPATEMPSAAQALSLVTFFGPAKKVTRLPAGTGELKV